MAGKEVTWFSRDGIMNGCNLPTHVDIFARERRTTSDAPVMTCKHGPEPHNTGRGLVDI